MEGGRRRKQDYDERFYGSRIEGVEGRTDGVKASVNVYLIPGDVHVRVDFF